MGKIKSKEYELKTGEKAIIRTADADDVQAILEHAQSVLAEEGHRVRGIKIADGNYVDDILMYKFVAG
ncbi:MAG: hypothetical protein JSV82_07075 [Planctomycetota bacterium]|nr:MAG: hypothetical protein JSV82_07075 [Planctomycetota bacterium]